MMIQKVRFGVRVWRWSNSVNLYFCISFWLRNGFGFKLFKCLSFGVTLLLVKKIIYIQDARSILIITVHKIILVNFFDFQWTRVNWKLEFTKKQMCKKLSLVTVHPRWFPMKASTDRHLIREVRHRCARWRGRWPCCWSSRVSGLS